MNTKKQLVAILLLCTLFILLVLAGCQRVAPTPESSTPSSSNAPSTSLPEIPSNETNLPRLNSALSKVEGFKELDDTVDSSVVVGIKHYGYTLNQEEIDQIENLFVFSERERHESYFLIVPRYNDSEIIVESMKIENEVFVPDEILLEATNLADDFALLLPTIQPEGGPILQVRVIQNNMQGIYRFTYDGSGLIEYPYINEGVYLIEGPAAGEYEALTRTSS